MTLYSGYFFVVTKWSLYRVTIPPDLRSRPTVQKWATRLSEAELGRKLKVGVTDSLKNGYFLGITSRGLFQYNVPKNHEGPPLTFDEIPGLLKGQGITHTTPPLALFLNWRHAEACYEMASEKSEGPFNPRWWQETREVLTMLSTTHPLVTISVAKNKFGVPDYLWDERVPLPFSALARSGS